MNYEEMITHQFHGGHDVTIVPISDVHFGAEECMEVEFRKFINSVACTENVYLTLGGDLIDNGTRNSVTNIFRATRSPHEQKKEMANILAEVRDRILCFVPGNHERRSNKDADDDPVYDIAAKLDLEHLYRDSIAFMAIETGVPRTDSGYRINSQYRPIYTVVVTHGAGGGMLTGGSVNRTERFGQTMTCFDVLITGHTHKPYTSVNVKIDIDKHNNKVTVKPFKVISMTSWLEYGGYAAQKMLLPSAHALHTLTLCGDHKEMIVTM